MHVACFIDRMLHAVAHCCECITLTIPGIRIARESDLPLGRIPMGGEISAHQANDLRGESSPSSFGQWTDDSAGRQTVDKWTAVKAAWAHPGAEPRGIQRHS